MGMFDRLTKTMQRTLYFREDLKVEDINLVIDDRFIKREQTGAKKQAWPFLPSLVLPVTFNDRYKGEYYLISGRTGEPLDPLNRLDDNWKGKNLWKKICELATEEHHKVTSKVHESRMARATMPLAIGAAGMTVLTALTAFMQR